jgi:hypothetical protein
MPVSEQADRTNTGKNRLELTRQQAQEIAWGACDPKEFVCEEEVIEGTKRWEILYSRVFQEVASGLYYRLCYRKGATEMQMSLPFEYDSEPIKANQVRQVIKTVEVWEDASE